MNSLFTDEGKLICPKCKKAQDVLAFTPLQQLEEHLTIRILKCKNCRFVFAPKP